MEHYLRLWLRDVDDRTAHTPDEDHTALCFPLHLHINVYPLVEAGNKVIWFKSDSEEEGMGEKPHQMPSNSRRKQISPVDIDAPELPHSINRVRNSLEVLCEPGRGHEVVYLAVLTEDLGDTGLDRLGV